MGKRAANVSIRPRRNDSAEKMIRRFKRKVKKEGIIEQVKRRRYHEKPSVKRRREENAKKRAIERAKLKQKAKKQTNYRGRR